jgi:2-keto-4-pentenoate hydratase/2-oxohepta-3-ene-1,7-dioic acid hydratase in catechol pathway
MKTLRYRNGSSVKPGILDNENNVRDVSNLIHDWDDTTVTVEKLESIKSVDINTLTKVSSIDSIAPCVCKKSIGKFICIGLNYSDHAEETGMEVPPEPIIFFKATSAIVGPNDDVHIPKKFPKV